MITPLKSLIIDDFSPGIYSSPSKLTSSAQKKGPAPLGAAQSKDTWSCIALPGGGLGPLPAISQSYDFPTVASVDVQVIGLECFGNLDVGIPFVIDPHKRIEVSVAWDWADGGGEQFRWQRMQHRAAAPGYIWTSVVTKTIVALSAANPSAFTATATRMINAGSLPTPVLAAGWTTSAWTAGFFWIYPQPPGGINVLEDNTRYGAVFGHQSRVLIFEPIGLTHGAGGIITLDNEMISYTDPPLGPVMGTQRTVLSAENPGGYGAIGSVSSGELFLVRQYGGALIMYDDIDYPRVVKLPGVVSTGAVAQTGSFCSLGMLYCVRGDGVYAWSGDSTSQKISSQLHPDFYIENLQSNHATWDKGAPYINHSTWGPFVVFPNNYIFDSRQPSWWKLLATTDDDSFQSNPRVALQLWASLGQTLYGCPRYYTAGGAAEVNILKRWELTGDPVSAYSWKSQPIAFAFKPHQQPVTMPDRGKRFSIRDVEVVMQSFDTAGGNSYVDVTLYDENDTNVGGGLRFQPAAIGGGVLGNAIKIRKKFAVPFDGNTVVVKLQAVAGFAGSPPLIYSVNLGYTEEILDSLSWS